MKITDERFEQLLREQKWIEPSADFTANVMERVAMERVLQSERVLHPVHKRSARRWFERALMVIPVILILSLFTDYARFAGYFAMDRVRELGFWLGHTTGFALFAAYPILILGIVLPVMAGAVATCAMSSQCRISRTLTY